MQRKNKTKNVDNEKENATTPQWELGENLAEGWAILARLIKQKCWNRRTWKTQGRQHGYDSWDERILMASDEKTTRFTDINYDSDIL